MADEAFALSPISARPVQPGEADYEAIREAFMETSRGRWFLGEYAKRNRNADTRMVLDAVERIEQTLAAQRVQPVDRVPEVLAAIKQAIEGARLAASAALDQKGLDSTLTPIHRGVRIIKEISWRWREIGADGRICDLIDTQLAAIESGCEQISAIDHRPELDRVFEMLKQQVEQAGSAGAESQQAAATAPSAAAGAAVQADSADDPEAIPAAEVLESETGEAAQPETAQAYEAAQPLASSAEHSAAEARAVPIDELSAPAADQAQPAAPHASAEPSDDEIERIKPAYEGELSFEAAGGTAPDTASDAEDEAILEMVALEMASADPDQDELFEPAPAAAATPVASHLPPGREPLAELPEAGTAVLERPIVQEEAAQEPMRNAPQPSLGSTILASGMLQKSAPSGNDPLAPIRRMTQAEKIAFFS